MFRISIIRWKGICSSPSAGSAYENQPAPTFMMQLNGTFFRSMYAPRWRNVISYSLFLSFSVQRILLSRSRILNMKSSLIQVCSWLLVLFSFIQFIVYRQLENFWKRSSVLFKKRDWKVSINSLLMGRTSIVSGWCQRAHPFGNPCSPYALKTKNWGHFSRRQLWVHLKS